MKARAIIGAVSALLIASPTHADGGKAVCAGKTYEDVTYATIDQNLGYFAIVSLWVDGVADEKAAKRTRPKYTIVLNSDMYCEFTDVWLHRRSGLEE
jgi:hypothetical protein